MASAFIALGCAHSLVAQDDFVRNFDTTAEGPWSDVEGTTLSVPLVPDGAVAVDGTPTESEYGGFEGVEVVPNINGWIQNFPGDRTWNDAADSSFTFWLAHDSTYLYVGVDVKDDVPNSDNTNLEFWKDDALEFVVDALNNRYDNNTDNSNEAYGGHCYVNLEGRFSEWDDTGGFIARNRWSSFVNWTYGMTGEIFAQGRTVVGGWQVEVRFAKTLFEDPVAGNRLENGYVMGFNIGMDDDDQRGSEGATGSGERQRDLEVQYWWANRSRLIGWNEGSAQNYTAEQIANGETEDDFPRRIDPAGRLAHGGTGEIVLAGPENGFEITEILLTEGGPERTVTLTWNSLPDMTYLIEAADVLDQGAFEFTGVPVASQGLETTTTISAPVGDRNQFYRIVEAD